MTDAKNVRRIDVWPTVAAAVASVSDGAKRVNRIDVWPTQAAARAHVSGGGGSSYTAKAVHFDGITARLKTSALSATDSGLVSFSYWFKLSSLPTNKLIWLGDDNNFITRGQITTGPAPDPTGAVPNIFFANSDDTAELNLEFANENNLISIGQWHNLLGSFKGDVADADKKAIVYLDDVEMSGGTLTTYGDAMLIAFNGLSFYLGDDGFGESAEMDIADFWFAPNVSLLDGTGHIPEATRRIFIDASGKPVNPSGFPISAILFSGDAAPGSFDLNQATGGAFTLTGSLTNASTSPSD
jgi:hypothetical protein